MGLLGSIFGKAQRKLREAQDSQMSELAEQVIIHLQLQFKSAGYRTFLHVIDPPRDDFILGYIGGYSFSFLEPYKNYDGDVVYPLYQKIFSGIYGEEKGAELWDSYTRAVSNQWESVDKRPVQMTGELPRGMRLGRDDGERDYTETRDAEGYPSAEGLTEYLLKNHANKKSRKKATRKKR